jgi:predicted RNA-binding protein with TRAM domain
MDEMTAQELEEGTVYDMRVDAKGARGEGIGKIGKFVVLVKNAKTRIGNMYKVRVTRVYRTFAYAELNDGKRQFIGSGSLIDFT